MKQFIFIRPLLSLLLFSTLSTLTNTNEEHAFPIQENKAYVQSLPSDISHQNSHQDFFDKLKKIYEKNNLSKISKNPAQKQKSNIKIPTIIHLVWFGTLPHIFETWKQEWMSKHPGWDFITWDNKLIEEKFPEKLFNQKIYDQAHIMSDYATMSKIVRYEILHKFGGLFIEPNLKCYKSFQPLHEQYDFYAGLASPQAYGAVSNSIIGARAGHPILQACMKEIKKSDGPLPGDTFSGGNWMMRHLSNTALTQAVYEKIDQENNIDTIFPQSFFDKNPSTSTDFHKDSASLEFLATGYPPQEKPMVIFIASYNNCTWYKRNLTSVFMQKYTNYRIIYIDDASPDGTGNLVENYIQEHNLKNKITLIKNKENKGGLANLYYAATLCDDNEIMVHLDGDDWLAHENVLAVLNKVYTNPNVWMTYGQFQHYPDAKPGYCKPFPLSVISKNKFREYRWITHHLKTCFVWLFKTIKIEDLQTNGNFIPSSWDQAFMLPMLEMARERIKFIPQLLYIYNRATPFNDDKVNSTLQKECAMMIKKQPKYQRLQEKPQTTQILSNNSLSDLSLSKE